MKEESLNTEQSKTRWTEYLNTLETDTRKKYTRVVSSYSEYCESNQIDTSHIQSIRKYMHWLRNNDKILVSTLRSYLSAISLWYSISFNALKPSESDEELKTLLNHWQLSDPHTQAGLFTLEDIENFLNADESMNKILEKKVFLLIGIYGLLRLGELSKLESKNVQKMNNNTYVITIMRNVQNKSLKTPTSFIIEGDRNINIIDRYIKALGNHVEGKFFKKLDSFQNISEKSMCDFTKEIANFLGKENYKSYTSHSIRRSGATILAEEGAAMTLIKAVGGWKSYNAVKRYMDNNSNNNNNNGNNSDSHRNSNKDHNIETEKSVESSYKPIGYSDKESSEGSSASHYLKRSSDKSHEDHSPRKKSNTNNELVTNNNSLELFNGASLESENMNDFKNYSSNSNPYDFVKFPHGYFPNYYFHYSNSAVGLHPSPPLINPFAQSILFNQLKNYYYYGNNSNSGNNNYGNGNISPPQSNITNNNNCKNSHFPNSNCQSCSSPSSTSLCKSNSNVNNRREGSYTTNETSIPVPYDNMNYNINPNSFWNNNNVPPFFQNYPGVTAPGHPVDPFFQQYLFSLYFKNIPPFPIPPMQPNLFGSPNNSSQFSSNSMKVNSNEINSSNSSVISNDY